ncbi:MAG: hypothetical protein COT73_00570 [Bdellovibrio sp. CG10_big_fil_rev_8_21_14_0_10_47_8]|nr:MAG: hypothetical protein COT73_00570 [Bdellovibrio sp. CG10_big_fil_rev_8_21_14_0_10_47_8]
MSRAHADQQPFQRPKKFLHFCQIQDRKSCHIDGLKTEMKDYLEGSLQQSQRSFFDPVRIIMPRKNENGATGGSVSRKA